MKFESAELGVSFELPDEPNALEIITYDSRRMEHYQEPALVVLWESIKPIIRSWECEYLPNPMIELEKITSYQAAQAIEFSAMRGSEWRLGLDRVPKNS